MASDFAVLSSDDFEPRELVRVFSMSIKTRCENDSEEESTIEKIIIEDFDTREKRRKRRLREIEEYLQNTRYEIKVDIDRS